MDNDPQDVQKTTTLPKTDAAIAAARKASSDAEFRKNANIIAFDQEVYRGNTPEKLLASLNSGHRGDIEAIKKGLGELGSSGRDITITEIEKAIVNRPTVHEAETIATLEALRTQNPTDVGEASSVSPTSQGVAGEILSSLKALKVSRVR